MAETVVVPKRHRWPRVLGWIILAFILLLVVLYFVVSSSAFFKGVILPRVSHSMNADITVADASIHPFSGVVLRNVKVQTTGPTPLLTAEEVRLAYDLGAIVRGNYHVKDVTVVSPDVEIVSNPDGTSNLDPITKKSAQKTTTPSNNAKTSKPSKPERVALNHLLLTNATVRLVKNYAGGFRDVTELTNANIVLTNLANGQSGGLALAANIAMDNHPPAPGTNAALNGVAAGNFAFTFSQDLKPVVVSGNAHFNTQNAGGSMNEFSGVSAILDCDVSPTDIKQVALRFEKNGGNLGGLNLSGPFDMAKTEGHLKLEVTPIDKQVLNLLGSASGIDFGSTALSSSNQLDFSQGGKMVAVSGQFNVNKATIARQNEPPTPALDLHSDYQVTVNRNDNSALLQTFNLNGTQNQQPLLHADLASPMNFSLGSGSNAKVGDSTLKCVVTNFNLADWKAALGDAASSGTMNMTLNLLSQQGGKQLTVDFNSQLANLTAKVGSNQLQQASMDLNGHLISQQENKALTGNVTLSDFNGTYENYRFQNYGTKVDLDIAMNKPQMEIKNISGTIVEGQNAGGSFKLSGNYNQNDKTGQLMLKLVDWNQNALRPFMGAFLGDKTLESVSLNSTTTANYASSGESSFKTDLQVTNLVVRDPKSQSPPTPLAANLQLDASLNKQVAQVRQLVLKLTPTDQAANNQITATGQLDLSQSNAIQGSLKLASDSLDVTRYYDLYSGKHNAAKPSTSNAAPPAPAQPQTAAANAEPPAKNLPIKNFTLDASIARLVLHEVNVSNFQTTARVEGSHAVLKPFQFSLNGGPVNATVDLDLGVPGYKYEMTFSGTNIPLAPLADTFSPEYKNNAKGEVFANLQIKGQGTTGASMQKTLSGQCDVLLTNANIQVVGAKSKKILTPIAAALKLPELLQSPITWLTADVTIGNGSIKITQFKAAGSAFSASSQGTVAIANVLSNSPIHDLPVNFALAGPLAAKARLMPSNANTNAAYVDLGKIATVQGTIGDPKTKVDYATIGLITARAAGGIIGGSTGNILKGAGGIGNLLNGQNPPANNQPNQSNTNQSQPNRSSGNPFDLLHKVLPK